MIVSVADSLDKYRFAEQVKFNSSQLLHEIALHGPQAAELAC